MRFKIDEEVSLVSKEAPELNCKCVVQEVVGNGYRVGVVGPNDLDLWHSSALKKRPKPSTKSFEEILKWKVATDG